MENALYMFCLTVIQLFKSSPGMICCPRPLSPLWTPLQFWMIARGSWTCWSSWLWNGLHLAQSPSGASAIWQSCALQNQCLHVKVRGICQNKMTPLWIHGNFTLLQSSRLENKCLLSFDIEKPLGQWHYNRDTDRWTFYKLNSEYISIYSFH